jgi:antitoxin (DNA-binding transcriptional repressor) of toxin-antitoxin stability system
MIEEIKYRDFRNGLKKYIGKEVAVSIKGKVVARLIPVRTCLCCGKEGIRTLSVCEEHFNSLTT